MLTYLWTRWIGGPCGWGGLASLPLPHSGLRQPSPGRLHSLLSGLPHVLPVPFLLFLPTPAQQWSEMQMEFPPGLSVTAHRPPSGSSPDCPEPVQGVRCPVPSLACPSQDTLCFRPDRPLRAPLVSLCSERPLSPFCALFVPQSPAGS